jgi:hypothetical protein
MSISLGAEGLLESQHIKMMELVSINLILRIRFYPFNDILCPNLTSFPLMHDSFTASIYSIDLSISAAGHAQLHTHIAASIAFILILLLWWLG